MGQELEGIDGRFYSVDAKPKIRRPQVPDRGARAVGGGDPDLDRFDVDLLADFLGGCVGGEACEKDRGRPTDPDRGSE
jgi:hypothetical protein